jgi:hypothetical protein
VKSNNIELLDEISGDSIEFDLIAIDPSKKAYAIEFVLELLPFELKTVIISESMFDSSKNSKVKSERVIDTKSTYSITNGVVQLLLDFDLN